MGRAPSPGPSGCPPRRPLRGDSQRGLRLQPSALRTSPPPPGAELALPGALQPRLVRRRRHLAPCARASRWRQLVGSPPPAAIRNTSSSPVLAGSSESDKNSPVLVGNSPLVTSPFHAPLLGQGPESPSSNFAGIPSPAVAGCLSPPARVPALPRPAPSPRAVCCLFDKHRLGAIGQRGGRPGNWGRLGAPNQCSSPSLPCAPSPSPCPRAPSSPACPTRRNLRACLRSGVVPVTEEASRGLSCNLGKDRAGPTAHSRGLGGCKGAHSAAEGPLGPGFPTGPFLVKPCCRRKGMRAEQASTLREQGQRASQIAKQ